MQWTQTACPPATTAGAIRRAASWAWLRAGIAVSAAAAALAASVPRAAEAAEAAACAWSCRACRWPRCPARRGRSERACAAPDSLTTLHSSTHLDGRVDHGRRLSAARTQRQDGYQHGSTGHAYPQQGRSSHRGCKKLAEERSLPKPEAPRVCLCGTPCEAAERWECGGARGARGRVWSGAAAPSRRRVGCKAGAAAPESVSARGVPASHSREGLSGGEQWLAQWLWGARERCENGAPTGRRPRAAEDGVGRVQAEQGASGN